MTSESVPVLSAAAEAVLRADVANLEARGRSFAGRHDILSLLATLDAERAASAARIEALEGIIEWFLGKNRYGRAFISPEALAEARAALTSEAHRG